MAVFDEAFQRTAAMEGGYVDDPDDAGGETYKGIARRFNPRWEGWRIIDDLKAAGDSKKEFLKKLDGHKDLQEGVRSFYKQQFWDKFWGDEIPVQALAEELFDTGVNMGVRRAVRFLQEGLNLLNRNQRDYADIIEDGLFGPGTLHALRSYLAKDEASFLLKVTNVLQGMHYVRYMKEKPSQEKYARGWLRRVSL
ncbi:MAG: hypothetical protein JW821_04555 [Deltaproteobacteria bacterium]|nr:hypothetical protein [Deltaproteobacteria bacterium]